MALRSIDLLAAPAQAPADTQLAIATTYAAMNANHRKWQDYKVPGGRPFPGLHPRYGTPCTAIPQLLSNTSKMPCPSWGLPAGKACPGAKYGEGTICGQCYASKGNYGVPMVRHALEERFRWTLALMKSAEGQDAFVAYMTRAIESIGSPYFRVHDSGDLFSPAYIRCWQRIARNLSHIRFWFPTRSYRILNLLAPIQELAAAPNVTIRPSALMLDAAPPVIPGLAAGSGATYSQDDATCPAYRQNGECRDCRHCWDNASVPVLYPLH
jgi:hypothetical protein